MATLLFCEDDRVIRKLIQVALRDLGHEVVITEDGQEGLEEARRLRPAAVFTDVSMPHMSGLELCQAIRADPQLRDTPVIVITASAQRAQLEEAARHGATDVLLKPFTIEELHATVARHVPAVGS